MKIVQIAIDSNQEDDLVDNLEGGSKGISAFIYGLGNDGKLYWWRIKTGEWHPAKKATNV